MALLNHVVAIIVEISSYPVPQNEELEEVWQIRPVNQPFCAPRKIIIEAPEMEKGYRLTGSLWKKTRTHNSCAPLKSLSRPDCAQLWLRLVGANARNIEPRNEHDPQSLGYSSASWSHLEKQNMIRAGSPMNPAMNFMEYTSHALFSSGLQPHYPFADFPKHSGDMIPGIHLLPLSCELKSWTL